jgi:hypothetical protein
MKRFKLIMPITLLAAAIGYADIVAAHTQAGAIGRKKLKAPGTDQFQVTCSNDGAGEPEHLFLHVRDMRPRNPALISVQAVVPATGATTPVSTDKIDGDAFFSPGLTLAGGVGPYLININKSKSTKAGAEIYQLEFHCETAGGVHTGTSEPEMRVNQ